MTGRFERLLPLAGVLGGLVYAAAVLLTINEPSITDGEQKYSRWYADHGTVETVSGAGSGYFCVLMVLFATALHRALRTGPRGSSAHAHAALVGGTVAATGVALMGIVSLANVEAADKHNSPAVISMGYLADSLWLLFVAGAAILYFATGLGALRTGVLPKWLGIATLALGVLCLGGPTGIGVFFATPVWLIVTGVVLYRRHASPTTSPVSNAPGTMSATSAR